MFCRTQSAEMAFGIIYINSFGDVRISRGYKVPSSDLYCIHLLFRSCSFRSIFIYPIPIHLKQFSPINQLIPPTSFPALPKQIVHCHSTQWGGLLCSVNKATSESFTPKRDFSLLPHYIDSSYDDICIFIYTNSSTLYTYI